MYNVDVGTKEWCEKAALFSPPPSTFSTSMPFLSVRLNCKDGGDPISLKVLEETLKINPMFDITVVEAEADKLAVIVSVEGEGELGEYEVLPWTAADPLVKALFQ